MHLAAIYNSKLPFNARALYSVNINKFYFNFTLTLLFNANYSSQPFPI